jgi:exopolysaccharide biosynthesis polyprenyl glycosylphosphotransferase
MTLFIGDVFFFTLALFVALLLRGIRLPTSEVFLEHLFPFSFLFLIWVFVYFVAGLYEKHTLILKNRIPVIIFNTQLINSAIAVGFFYLVPFFGIAPKTILFIYLVASFFFILSWRIYGQSLLHLHQKEQALLIGSGEELKELMAEVNNNPRYDIHFISSIDATKLDSLDFQSEILDRVYSEEVHVVVADTTHPKIVPLMPHMYNLIFSNIRFVDMHRMYEDIFDRIPLSLVSYSWFLENISTSRKIVYDVLKRLMDIVIAGVAGVVSLLFYPFVILLIKLEDGGPIFFTQERVGKNNHTFLIRKFRSMSVHNEVDGIAKKPTVTKIGYWLRKLSIDELPQLWSVVRGNLSLIGPRPEIPALVKVYEQEVPYYNVRHLIKPGLSGWAQLYHKTPPKFAAQVDATAKKVSYDLFYIKNRSLLLDIVIALKTVKAVVFRGGI